MDLDFSKLDAYDPDIARLQWELEMSKKYIESYYANPGFGIDERLGYCKAVVEYAPKLILMMKLNQKRASMIQDEDLWQQIKRLEDKVQEQAAELKRRALYTPPEIKDTHYHKPDPRLVSEENYG